MSFDDIMNISNSNSDNNINAISDISIEGGSKPTEPLSKIAIEPQNIIIDPKICKDELKEVCTSNIQTDKAKSKSIPIKEESHISIKDSKSTKETAKEKNAEEKDKVNIVIKSCKNITSKQALLIIPITKYFSNKPTLNKLITILKGESISLRLIDWFVTNFCKKNNVLYNLNDFKEESEKADKTKEQLQSFIDSGCIKNGFMVSMGSTNPNKQFAAKQESTLTPGKFRYFFADNTYGTVGPDGKFRIGSGTWECNTGRIESNKASDAKLKAGSEEAKKATDANIENLKKEGGWKTYDELIATETKENIANPAMYEKKVVDGITLYRRTSGRGITSGLDKRQQDVITKFKNMGYKLENEVNALEAKAWTKKVVSPKSDGLFSEDLIMYAPPTTITNTDITTAFEDAVRDQTPESAEDCKKAIESYYFAYNKGKTFTDDVLSAMNEKVKACHGEFYGNWGTFGGGKKIDGYLYVMTGKAPRGPQQSSPWRIKISRI